MTDKNMRPIETMTDGDMSRCQPLPVCVRLWPASSADFRKIVSGGSSRARPNRSPISP